MWHKISALPDRQERRDRKEVGEVSWRKRGRKPRLQKNRPNLYLLYKYIMKIFLNIIPVSGINLNFEGTAEFLKNQRGPEF